MDAQYGTIAEDGIHIPLDESNMTTGVAMVEFATAAQAEAAVTALKDGYRFDARHFLTVSPYRLHELVGVPDEPPAVDGDVGEFEELEDELHHLKDKLFREQFLVQEEVMPSREVAADDTHRLTVQWASSDGSFEDEVVPEFFSKDQALWSPRGRFLAIIQRDARDIVRGVKVWSGPNLQSGDRKFLHPDVRHVQFSPDERYLLTWSGRAGNSVAPASSVVSSSSLASSFLASGSAASAADAAAGGGGGGDGFDEAGADAGNADLIVWDVVTGHKMRTLPQVLSEHDLPETVWTADSRFLARLAPDSVEVFEAPSAVRFVHRVRFRAQGVEQLSACPAKRNLLAWFAPERGATPANVTLVSLPSRETVRTRNLYSVDRAHMLWQDQGDYLAVRVDQTKLSKSQTAALNKKREAAVGITFLQETYINGASSGGGGRGRGRGHQNRSDASHWASNLIAERRKVMEALPESVGRIDIFRLGDKDTPIDSIDIDEPILHVAWEPRGQRLAVVHGRPTKARLSVFHVDAGSATSTGASTKGSSSSSSSSSAEPAAPLPRPAAGGALGPRHERKDNVPQPRLLTPADIISLASGSAAVGGSGSGGAASSGAAGAPAARLQRVFTIEGLTANHVSWCPRGGILLLSNLESVTGELTFFDCDRQELLSAPGAAHSHLKRVEWDPSGRLVATVKDMPFPHLRSASTADRANNAVIFWKAIGVRVAQRSSAMLYTFQWRPRPANLVFTDEELKTLMGTLRTHWPRFEEEERLRESKKKLRELVRQRSEYDEFLALEAELEAEYVREAPERRRLHIREDDPTKEPLVDMEHTIDVVLTTQRVTKSGPAGGGGGRD